MIFTPEDVQRDQIFFSLLTGMTIKLYPTFSQTK